MEAQIRLPYIYKSFDSGMQALYDLNSTIQDSLGNIEWKSIEEYYQEILSLFDGYDPIEIHAIMERLIKIDIEDDTLDYKKIWEATNIQPDDILRLENDREVFISEIQDGLKKFAETYPEKANIFFRAYLKSLRSEPLKSEVSRRGLLLSAVSQFEFLLLYLLRGYFIYYDHDVFPNGIPTIEELDEAISQKIGKKLKYYSIFDKLDFIVSKFPLNQEFKKNTLKEIIERRNIFVHRGGRADETYVKFNDKVRVGDRLRIGQNYIRDALEYLHIWGLVLCLRVWEKMDEPDQKELGKSITTTAMQLIRQRRYSFCAILCQQLHDNINFKSVNNKEILMINHAICMDKLGDEKRKLKILSGIRQAPREMITSLGNLVNQDPFLYPIPMAVNILTGKKQYAMDLLERAIEANQITFLDLDHWVIFDYLADEPRFAKIKDNVESKIKIT